MGFVSDAMRTTSSRGGASCFGNIRRIMRSFNLVFRVRCRVDCFFNARCNSVVRLLSKEGLLARSSGITIGGLAYDNSKSLLYKTPSSEVLGKKQQGSQLVYNLFMPTASAAILTIPKA